MRGKFVGEHAWVVVSIGCNMVHSARLFVSAVGAKGGEGQRVSH